MSKKKNPWIRLGRFAPDGESAWLWVRHDEVAGIGWRYMGSRNPDSRPPADMVGWTLYSAREHISKGNQHKKNWRQAVAYIKRRRIWLRLLARVHAYRQRAGGNDG